MSIDVAGILQVRNDAGAVWSEARRNSSAVPPTSPVIGTNFLKTDVSFAMHHVHI